MSLTDLARVVDDTPAAKLSDVMALMQAIDASLLATDGISYFNKLYWKVTEQVAQAIDGGAFENAPFVHRLDVVFANLYFDALRSFVRNPDAVPRAWYPLFAANREQGIAPIQFALAGMNAHINRDLMVAVVKVCEESGNAPRDDSSEKRDYDRLNPILQEVETQVHELFAAQGLIKELDVALGDVDSIIANWSVVEARDAAWSHAEMLWRIRRLDIVEEAFLEGLDGLVGFAGRGLLLRAPRL